MISLNFELNTVNLAKVSSSKLFRGNHKQKVSIFVPELLCIKNLACWLASFPCFTSVDRDLARPETKTSLIALSQTVNPLTDNRRQESSSCLQSLEFWPAGSGPHGPPQAAHPAHPSQQIIILKTIPLECYHLGAFHLVLALLFLILCGLQGGLIL